MNSCPNCGIELRRLPELYSAEVLKIDGDPDRLSRLAPPTNRAAIHGFIMGVLIWISLLVPFFVVNHFWRSALPTWGLTLLWVWLFVRARARDRELRRAYEARRACLGCGWMD